jgi:hypothetical protein
MCPRQRVSDGLNIRRLGLAVKANWGVGRRICVTDGVGIGLLPSADLRGLF